MDGYDDHDDHDDVIASDSDDDEVDFVSSKRRFQYSTFGDDGGRQKDDDENDEMKASIYGVFRESGGDRGPKGINPRGVSISSSTPQFVKGSTKQDSAEKVEVTSADFAEVEPQVVVEDPDEKRIEEQETILRKQQEQANQKFLSLLGRGRGAKRKRHDGSSELEQQRPELQGESEGQPSFHAEGRSGGGLGLKDSIGGKGGLGFHSANMSLGGGGLGSKPPIETDDPTPSFGGLGSTPAMFGTQMPSLPLRVDPNLGKWEKHTKGIGMKLLAKMGYKGSGGLGAKSKKKTAPGSERTGGISRPVEVVVRPNNLGLGFGNFREATKLKANQQIEAEIRGEELPKKRDQNETLEPLGGEKRQSSALPSTDELMKHQSWKRGANQVPRKRQRRTVVPYKDILEKQTNAAIIDMRGPSDATNDTGEPPLAQELLHNVSMLLNTHENKLRSTSHFLETSQQKLQSLESDLDSMKRRKSEGQERILTLKKVLLVVDKIESISKEPDGGGNEVTTKVHSLVEELRKSLKDADRIALQFDGVLVPTLFGPFIKSHVNEWEPLCDGTEKAASIVESLMNLGSSMDDAAVIQERRRSILCRDILPRVKTTYESTKWNPVRDSEAGVHLYESLLKTVMNYAAVSNETLDDTNVFPHNPHNVDLRELVSRELIAETVFPKLMCVLGQWKPELKGEQINDGLESWLLPWMPHLDHLTVVSQLSSDLKRKIRSALSCLNSGVVENRAFLRSAMSTLGPWKTTLKKEIIHELTSKYIIPRFIKAFSRSTFESNTVEPAWFEVDTLIAMYNMSLMPHLEFLSLVEGELLSTWRQELHRRLSLQTETNLRQPAKLYATLRDRLLGAVGASATAQLRSDTFVCRIFYTGLKMIQLAAKGKVDALAALAPRTTNYRAVLARRVKDSRGKNEEELERLQAKNAMEFRKRVISRQFGDMATFREVVEDFAREHEVSFRPRTGGKGTTEDGKRVFLFGDIPIYLDIDVIFSLQNAKWSPVSIEELLISARGDTAGRKLR